MLILALFCLPNPAAADIKDIQFSSFSCANASTAFTVKCNSNGAFGRVVCLFESTLGLVTARFFCSIREHWLEPFGALVLLFMATTGIAFLSGMVPMTIKEMAIIMFKLGLIVTFVMNEQFAMNIAFKFFMSVTSGTVEMLTSAMGGSQSLGDTTDNNITMTAAHAAPNCKFYVNKNSFGLGTSAFVADFFIVSIVIMVLIALIFLPFIIGVFAMALIAGSGFLGRAAFGYLYSLVMLTFLIAAMPIFISFALFRTTNDLFEAWLKYLFSNSLQIIMVFGFLALTANLQMFDFLGALTSLMTSYEMGFTTPPLSFLGNFSLCTFCDPNFNADGTEIMKIPNQCKQPVRAMFFTEVLFHEGLLYYLVLKASIVYATALVLQDFMKDVPDIAQTLGGSASSMIIGGISRNYNPQNPGNSLQAPGLTNASINIEQGAKQGWRNSDYALMKGGGLVATIVNRSAVGRLVAGFGTARRMAFYGQQSALSVPQQRERKRSALKSVAESETACADCQSKVDKFKKEMEELEREKERIRKMHQSNLDVCRAATGNLEEKLREEIKKNKQEITALEKKGSSLTEADKTKLRELDAQKSQLGLAMRRVSEVKEQEARALEKASNLEKMQELYRQEAGLVKEAGLGKVKGGMTKEEKAASEKLESLRKDITAQQEVANVNERLKQLNQQKDELIKKAALGTKPKKLTAAQKEAQLQLGEVMREINAQLTKESVIGDSALHHLRDDLSAALDRTLVNQNMQSDLTRALEDFKQKTKEHQLVSLDLSNNVTATAESLIDLSYAEKDYEQAEIKRQAQIDLSKNARYLLGQMDENGKLSAHGSGLIGEILEEGQSQYLGNVRQTRKQAWETLLHYGD